jgi:hypothetical protein
MKLNLSIIAVYLMCLDLAIADYYEDFVKDYQKKHPYLSPNPADNSTRITDANCPDYHTGYPGCPIFDKHGKLVIFEGNSVSRQFAEEYTRNYNEKQK